ncbi:hypothetical protein G5714_020144 [Onychostoma macrolepis]|uniref:Uncharacterized protein n=1 Tax=Onychostoma macrolepis TaxID=369639 RepID=A0A7J6BYF1_9TELE|nr:hypothetical protein G5714_020144 [Onychostoma macrolepis]
MDFESIALITRRDSGTSVSSALFSQHWRLTTCTLASSVTQPRLQASPAADKTAVPTRRKQVATPHPVDLGFQYRPFGPTALQPGYVSYNSNIPHKPPRRSLQEITAERAKALKEQLSAQAAKAKGQRGETPMDFKSIALTSRPQLRLRAGLQLSWLQAARQDTTKLQTQNPAEG